MPDLPTHGTNPQFAIQRLIWPFEVQLPCRTPSTSSACLTDKYPKSVSQIWQENEKFPQVFSSKHAAIMCCVCVCVTAVVNVIATVEFVALDVR